MNEKNIGIQATEASFEMASNKGTLSGNFEHWWSGLVAVAGRILPKNPVELENVKRIAWSAFLTGADVAMSSPSKQVLNQLDDEMMKISRLKN